MKNKDINSVMQGMVFVKVPMRPERINDVAQGQIINVLLADKINRMLIKFTVRNGDITTRHCMYPNHATIKIQRLTRRKLTESQLLSVANYFRQYGWDVILCESGENQHFSFAKAGR